MRILTAAQIRAVEERAVDTGLDYLRLMENAGSACARFVAEKAQITLESNTAATVVCGKGKNGGDGFVIARKLYDKGAEVSVVLAAGHPVAADALEIWRWKSCARRRYLWMRCLELDFTGIRMHRPPGCLKRCPLRLR